MLTYWFNFYVIEFKMIFGFLIYLSDKKINYFIQIYGEKINFEE